MAQQWQANPQGQYPRYPPQQPRSPQQSMPYPGNAQPPQPYPPQPPPQQPYPPQPYPPQPYPQQPFPNQGYPGPAGGGPMSGAPAGPLTLPNWAAALVGVLGFAATLVGMFALPWLSNEGNTASFLDIWEAAELELEFAPFYVVILSFAILAVLPLTVLPWTLGAVRTDASARWLSGVFRHNLSHRTFVKYRAVYGSRAFLALVLHGAGIASVYNGDFEFIGAGPWVLLGGCAISVVSALIGPRKGPGLPQNSL